MGITRDVETGFVVNACPRDLILSSRCEGGSHPKGQSVHERVFEALEQVETVSIMRQVRSPAGTRIALTRILHVRGLCPTRHAVLNGDYSSTRRFIPETPLSGRCVKIDPHFTRRARSVAFDPNRLATSGT